MDFFGSWSGVLRVVLVGLPAYLALVLMLRVAGKRTVAKMNAFDLVVTIALGSALSATMLSPSVPLVEGLTGLALLIAVQFAITWSGVRSPHVRRFFTGEPRLLFFRGRIMDHALRRERITRGELEAAVRSHGLPSLSEAEAVILETDGSTAVVPKRDWADTSSLERLGQP